MGVLMRSAYLYRAAFVFTIGTRYSRVASDTPDTTAQIPNFHFDTIEAAERFLPVNCPLVGIEMDERAVPLPKYQHPARAAYLLGAEDDGIPAEVLARCTDIVQIPTPRPYSMNVAAAGSILLADRHLKSTS